ncbi:MAG TPA: hypothetical protein VF472_21135 [Burkholderiaceae bacterium]
MKKAAISFTGSSIMIGKLPGRFAATQAMQEDAQMAVGVRIGCTQGIFFEREPPPAMHERHIDRQAVVPANQVISNGSIEYADARRSPMRESVYAVFPGIHDIVLAT